MTEEINAEEVIEEVTNLRHDVKVLHELLLAEKKQNSIINDTLDNLKLVKEGIEEKNRLIQQASDLLHRAWKLTRPAIGDDDEAYRWYRDVEAWWRDQE